LVVILRLIGVFVGIFLKWKNSLVLISLLETSAVLVLAIILSSSGIAAILFVLLPFFVSEALVTLSAFYKSVRVSSSALNSLSFY